jgi:hypothetical protein
LCRTHVRGARLTFSQANSDFLSPRRLRFSNMQFAKFWMRIIISFDLEGAVKCKNLSQASFLAYELDWRPGVQFMSISVEPAWNWTAVWLSHFILRSFTLTTTNT